MSRRHDAAPLVLVVDDEPLILHLIAEELISAGCTVVRVRTAEAALALLDGYAPVLSALVVDVDLGPGPTGFEVARHARALNPLLPVIYATGRPAQDVAAQAVPGGTHLAKPFSVAALVRQIAAATQTPLSAHYRVVDTQAA